MNSLEEMGEKTTHFFNYAEFHSAIDSPIGVVNKRPLEAVIVNPTEIGQEPSFKVRIRNQEIFNKEPLIQSQPVLHCLFEALRSEMQKCQKQALAGDKRNLLPVGDNKESRVAEEIEDQKNKKSRVVEDPKSTQTSGPKASPTIQIPNEITLSKSDFEKLVGKLQMAQETEVKMQLGKPKS